MDRDRFLDEYIDTMGNKLVVLVIAILAIPIVGAVYYIWSES